MKINFIFAWYDFWVGLFIDKRRKLIYFFPIPMFGLVFNFQKLYLAWKYRNHDPEICCCGERIGHGGSICYHGGCRSVVEYLICCELENMSK